VAIEERIETGLALGRGGDLVAELEQLIGAHPFRERLRGLLMVALYRTGRQAEALQAYRDARAVLVEELGIEPGPALRELEKAILRQDPSLELKLAAGREVSAEPAARRWLPRERRMVTVVAVDLSPSPEPGADAEAVGRLGARATDVATEVLRRHGARVEHIVGDMLMAFFGFPLAHEDDAVRAVRAAVELRAAVEALNADVPTVEGVRYSSRTGIETGDIVVGGPGASLRDVVSGQVVTAAGRLQQAGADGDVIVGAATADPRRRRAETGRGHRSGRRRRDGEDDGTQVAGEIAAAIGLTPEPGNVNTLFAAVRRLFQTLAADRPLVVVLEDLHWAEPTFLDLVDDLARAGSGGVFVLCLARPDLIERRPGWETADTLFLEPLPAREIEDLIVDRAGAVPPETLQRIVATARGNPPFAEQLLAAFDDGTVDAIPASLQGLLTMRLDRLGPGERDLLRCAAVVGTESSQDVLSALLPDEARPFVDRHLEALGRKQLIASVSENAFRFGHVLIHLAAYQSMTREDRARLHERFADWLETEASDQPPELDEIVGYHLEQAIEHRRASGVADTAGSVLAIRAGERLGTAAERAVGRNDQTAAENLMSRARSLLPLDHAQRPVLTQRLAEVHLVLGRFSEAQEMLRDLMEAAAAAGDPLSERAARLEHARIQFIIGPDPVPLAAIRQEAEEAAEFYAEAGDEAGRGRASFLLACVHMRAGSMTGAEDAFQESLALADRSGHVRERLGTRWSCRRWRGGSRRLED